MAVTNRPWNVRALVPIASAAMALATPARAEEAPAQETPRTDQAQSHTIDRAWLYLDDARVAAPMTVVGMTAVSYTSVGSDPNRIYTPFASNTAQPGALLSLGAEAGVLPRMSVMALGQMAAGGEGAKPNAGAIAGLRFQLSPETWRNVHLLASAGYLREAWTPSEAHGDNGVWGEAALVTDFQPVRAGVTVHGEHVFADGRDAVDVMVKAGASYRVVGPFRAGVEYVGQDLEAAVSGDAEQGARHFIGPTASLQLLSERLTVVAGPSLGLSDRSPKLLGRLALAYGF